MKNKQRLAHRYDWFYFLELLIGIVLLVAVFILASNIDMKETQNHLSGTISYIKEQYNQHKRLNLASETKSIMRMIESTQHMRREIRREQKKDADFVPDTAFLKRMAKENYVSGILIMNRHGKILWKYCHNGIPLSELKEYITSDTLLNTGDYLQKAYAVRIDRADDSYVDLAALGTADGSRIIVSYYYTPIEYINAFSNSVEALLKGYSLERDGTIVISSGTDIVASNNEKLIGKSTDDVAILRKIREKAVSGKLVHTRRRPGSWSQNFGLMEHGRDYYVYAYMPETDVFSSTFQNVLYSLIIYIIILVVINMVRWKTAQSYREKQMTIQREYTERLQRKNEQLQQALDLADRANAAKTSFLSRMSHDIRTPLNGIIGLLEISETHPEDIELLQKNQKKMRISANHLLSLINDVLQMSKLESGKAVFSNEAINLTDLSHDVLTIVEQRAADAGITLEYDKNDERAAMKHVYGSPLHLRQIFLNIYGNCIKYNKVGGKVWTRCTCLGTKDETITYCWTIQDTGVGMSQEFLEHIFEPFAQERTDARSVYNGTGLGMSIVKSLIDKMNGSIEVSSKLGEGTKFTIIIPFRLAEDVPQQTKETDNGVAAQLEGLHLLLVEDNELNAEIAQTLLKDRGFQTDLAVNGQQALDLFKENPPETFDAILMDIMMPVMDGISAARAIRSLDRSDAKKIPIIAMTANTFDEDVEQCINAGMNAHLSKPLQIEQLMAALGKYCHK